MKVKSHTIIFISIFCFSLTLSAQENQSKYQELEKLYLEGHFDSTIVNLDQLIPNTAGDLQIDYRILRAKCTLGNTAYKATLDSSLFIWRLKGITKDQKIQSIILAMNATVSTRINFVNDIEYWINELESLIDTTRNNETIGYLYYLKARNAYRKNDFNTAIGFFEKSLNVFPKTDPNILDIYFWSINIFGDEHKFDHALNQLEETQRLQKLYFPNHPFICKLITVKSEIHWQMGNFQESLKVLDEELTVFIEGKNYKWIELELWYSYLTGYRVSSSLGDFYKSIQYLKKKSILTKKILGPQSPVLADDYYNLYYQFYSLNDLESANYYFQESDLIYGKQKRFANFYSLKQLINRAEFFQKSKKYAKAEAIFLNVLKRDKNEWLGLRVRPKYAKLLNEIGKKEQAKDLWKLIISDIKTSKEIDEYTSDIYRNYLSLLLETNDSLEIKKISNFLLEKANKIPHPTIDISNFKFFNEFNNYLINRELYDSANSLITKVLVEQKEIPYYRGRSLELAKSHMLMAKLIYKEIDINNNTNRIHELFAEIEKSIEFLKSFKEFTTNKTDRYSIQKSYDDIVAEGIAISYHIFKKTQDIKHIYNAFQLAELSKSQELLESLNKNIAIKNTVIPDSLISKIKSLEQQESYLNTKLFKLEQEQNLTTKDSTILFNLKNELYDNRIHYNDLQQYLNKNFPQFQSVNNQPRLLPINSIQSSLQPNDVFIEYFTFANELYVFVIKQQFIDFQKIDFVSATDIQTFIQSTHLNEFETNSSNTLELYGLQAHNLYNKLLHGLLNNNNQGTIKNITIVPSNHLNYLPFELLLSKSISQSASFDNLRYLIKDFNISYAYSASILFNPTLQNRETEFNGSLLAVAPSYKSIFQNEVQQEKLGKFRDDFSELLFNTEEVNNISQYFDSKVLKGNQASENAFLEEVRYHDIIHLAMHALIDNEDSKRSKFVFTQSDDSTNQDNLLHNYEIYNMEINSKLAVLSACNSGYGELEDGEGLMSLARAFTYAGSESVVMSHWQVEDKSSSIIMTSFYKYLSQGKRKDAALRLAKMDFLKSASVNKQHPFFWNNFVVYGNINPLIVQTKWYQNYYWLSGILILAFFTLIFLYKRKTQL